MRKIYLIRHAKPDFPDGEKMCLGTTDIPLSTVGMAQAKEMAEKLPRVSSVFSSPLQRAIQTAQAIDPDIRIIPGLREYHMGRWDGLTFCQIRELDPDLYAARGRDLSIPVPGEENRGEGLTRFMSAVQDAVDQSNGDIAVIAHGGVIAAFREFLGGKWEKPGYAEILLLTYDGTFYLEEENAHA